MRNRPSDYCFVRDHLCMLSPYQKTQSMYGMTMSAICGMLLYTMWEGLSTHDKKWSAGLVGGRVSHAVVVIYVYIYILSAHPLSARATCYALSHAHGGAAHHRISVIRGPARTRPAGLKNTEVAVMVGTPPHRRPHSFARTSEVLPCRCMSVASPPLLVRAVARLHCMHGARV